MMVSQIPRCHSDISDMLIHSDVSTVLDPGFLSVYGTDTLKVNHIFSAANTLQCRSRDPNGCLGQTRGTGIDKPTEICPLGL